MYFLPKSLLLCQARLDGQTPEYHPSLFPLSICDEGLETRDGEEFYRQFREARVTPAESLSVLHEGDSSTKGNCIYLGDLTLICTRNH